MVTFFVNVDDPATPAHEGLGLNLDAAEKLFQKFVFLKNNPDFMAISKLTGLSGQAILANPDYSGTISYFAENLAEVPGGVKFIPPSATGTAATPPTEADAIRSFASTLAQFVSEIKDGKAIIQNTNDDGSPYQPKSLEADLFFKAWNVILN